jgi:hypothetical protein
MPMSNNNFVWRPNDNGAITNIRYSLEANKWVQAVRSAETRNRPMTAKRFKGDLDFIGNLIQLPLLLIFMIILIPVRIIKEVFGFNIKIFVGDEPTGWVKNEWSAESLDNYIADLKVKYPKPQKKQWEDLSIQEQEIVNMVRAESAKAKSNL